MSKDRAHEPSIKGDAHEARRGSHAAIGQTEARTWFAGALRSSGDLEKAEVQLRIALAAGEASALEDLAALLAQRGQTEEAEVMLRTQVQQGNVEYALQLADLLSAADCTNEEAEHWYEVARSHGDQRAPNNYGVYLLRRGRLNEAAQALSPAARSGDVLAIGNLGRVRVEQQLIPEGIEFLLDAVLLGEVQYLIDLADAYTLVGETTAAQTIYHAAIRNRVVAARNDLANLLVDLDRLTEAEELYRQAVALEEHDASWNLALLLEKTGRSGEAIDQYRAAAAAGHRDAHLNLAELLVRQGDNAKAQVEFGEAIQQGDSDAWAPYAAFLAEQGQRDALRELLRQAGATELSESTRAALSSLEDDGADQ